MPITWDTGRAYEPEHRNFAFVERVEPSGKEGMIFRPHRHAQPELIFVVTGEFVFSSDGREERFGPGEIFVANSGEEHFGRSVTPEGEQGIYYYLHLSVAKAPHGLSEELDRLLDRLDRRQALLPYRISAEQGRETGLFYRGMELADCWSVQKGYNEFKLLCRTLALWQVILEHRLYIDTEHREREEDPLVRQLILYIDRHYAEELRLETVAKLYGYEPHYFCTLFKKKFEMPFTKYVNAVRMQKFLSHPRLNLRTIAQCAADVGFSNYSYFHRIFRRVYGDSPGNYLMRHRE